MNSIQYEELCRFFLANKLGMSIGEIQSVRIPNPKRPGLPDYNHQIDLYWETGDAVALYLNIANAKWRSTEKVDQDDVLLLQQVRIKVAAHKAMVLSNSEFTRGAKAAAKDDGISLHVVNPAFDYTKLPAKDRYSIQTALQEIASHTEKPIYLHQIVHRAFDWTDVATKPITTEDAQALKTKVITGYATKATPVHSTKIATPTPRVTVPQRSGKSSDTVGTAPVQKGGQPGRSRAK